MRFTPYTALGKREQGERYIPLLSSRSRPIQHMQTFRSHNALCDPAVAGSEGTYSVAVDYTRGAVITERLRSEDREVIRAPAGQRGQDDDDVRQFLFHQGCAEMFFQYAAEPEGPWFNAIMDVATDVAAPVWGRLIRNRLEDGGTVTCQPFQIHFT